MAVHTFILGDPHREMKKFSPTAFTGRVLTAFRVAVRILSPSELTPPANAPRTVR